MLGSRRCQCTRPTVSIEGLPWCHALKQMFDFEFLAPYSGGFIPVYFGQPDCAIPESNARNPLAFTPAIAPIDSPQSGDFADFRSCGEGFDVRNLAQNLKSHKPIVSGPSRIVNAGSASNKKRLQQT